MRRKIVINLMIFLCIVGFLSYYLYTQTLSVDNLYLFKQDGKYGFMNNKGKIKIKPRFYDAKTFTYGLAPVKIKDTEGLGWGYIDTKGKVVIEPQFTGARNFYEDIALVYFGSGLPYGINRQGKFVSESKVEAYNIKYQMEEWDPIDPFKIYNGPIPYIVDDKIGYKDSNGKVIIAPILPKSEQQLISYGKFTEGLAPVIKLGDYNIETKYTFIDMEGKLAIPFQVGEAKNFSCGLALITVDEGNRMHYFYINKKGETVIDVPKDYEKPDNFVGGIAQVYINGELQYIDKKGHVIRPH